MSTLNASAFGGIDWATDDHAVCIVDDTGEILDEFVIEHTTAGLRGLCSRLRDRGVARVAIERPDGPVVDALMDHDLEVIVVRSRTVKAFRDPLCLVRVEVRPGRRICACRLSAQ